MIGPAQKIIGSWGFREFASIVIFGLFVWAFWMDPKNGQLQGAVLTAFAAAYGYYIGGSKTGSDSATMNAATVSNSAASALTTPEPDPTSPKPVIVTNTIANPVPVEGKS